MPLLCHLDDVTLTGVVPEPSSIALRGCGLAACSVPVLRRRIGEKAVDARRVRT